MNIQEVFGDSQQVYLAIELTKRYETHFRGEVYQVIEEIQKKYEGSRIKGEVTLVVGPHSNEEENVAKAIKGSGFNPKRDAKVSVNVVEVAK